MSSSKTVYQLQSDKQFITSGQRQADIDVFEYKGVDPNAFDMIYAGNSRWVHSAAVGPSANSQFKAVEVLGVKIGDDQLKELAKDLAFVDKKGHTLRLMVNRQGLCLLLLNTQSVTWLRCNDRFGWSKYEVKPKNNGPIWSVCDMSNGDVLADRKDDGGGNEYLKKLLEEKEKEVASLKAAVRSLIGDHK